MLPTSPVRFFIVLILLLVLVIVPFPGDSAFAQGDIGGEDLVLLSTSRINGVSMDIASNGDIYLASQFLQTSGLHGIQVFRSQNDGATWSLWGILETAPGEGDTYTQPFLKVVEGTVAKCFLVYNHGSNLFTSRIMMVSSFLSDTEADFSVPTTVMSTAGVAYQGPRFDTDVSGSIDFKIFVVAQAGYNGGDIAFARSTDQGASFETPYVIGNLVPTDRDYSSPDVSYGFGGYVNVTWQFLINDTTFDSAIRYRRASNLAAGGIADWSGIYGLGSTSDGEANNNPRIRASATGAEVVIVCERQSAVKGADGITDPGVFISSDSGATYPVTATIPNGMFMVGNIVEQPGTGNWFVCGEGSGETGIVSANVADLTTWTPTQNFADVDYDQDGYVHPFMALNPHQGGRPAMVWTVLSMFDDDQLMFDGDWRSDPGYPNMEPGFPVRLDHESLSAPSVVDVNGDGNLEIVFGDKDGNIQVYRNDGTPLSGWPVNIGEALSESPIAVGDLEGNGVMSIVAGSTTGKVYRFKADGQLAPGNWPFSWGAEISPAFVAIGAFGQGPYPRGIVGHAGNHGYFLDHKGEYYPGTTFWTMGQDASNAPAIGDVDGDGLPDVAFSHETAIAVTTIFGHRVIFGKFLSDDISGALTMGDIDQDGDQEIVVPLADGTLHVFDDDGTDLPGFPFVSPTGSALSTAAIGQMLGNWEPEIVTAARNYEVHLLWYDGHEGIGWPASTGGWANYASPVIGHVDGSSSDVVLGTRGRQSWGWDNFGNVIPGWPKTNVDNCYVAPAMGDIDLDGSTEIVFLSSWYLMVVDINQTANEDFRTWAMAGHDFQRTGCSDCPEDVVTPVVDDPEAVTLVSFAAPSPNPSSGSATFRFAVPGPAVVNLEVFDVRGHRVSLVTREEVDAGSQVVSWGGLDDRGAPLASGLYFARLRVQGPGIDEELTRKITLTR